MSDFRNRKAVDTLLKTIDEMGIPEKWVNTFALKSEGLVIGLYGGKTITKKILNNDLCQDSKSSSQMAGMNS